MEIPFRADHTPGFRLIETFGFHPEEGFVRLDRHLARMARSARALQLPFDLSEAERVVASAQPDGLARCRLTLDPTGAFAITATPTAPETGPWRVAVHTERLTPDDPWLRIKSTRRKLYDEARAALPEGIDEWLFLNTRGELCEGTITNLFVEFEGKALTPQLSSGLLPGILRETLLESGAVEETVITQEMLTAASRIWVGNSLRGLIEVQIVA